jgi:hypothetical protein
MVGLSAGTHSKLAVIGGILTIAIADAFSDALGIHVSEESENKHTTKEIWMATLCTFLSKFIIALTFAVGVLLFPLIPAIIINIVWGLLLLGFFSFFIARNQASPAWKVILEHELIAIAVIAATHFLGYWIASVFQ